MTKSTKTIEELTSEREALRAEWKVAARECTELEQKARIADARLKAVCEQITDKTNEIDAVNFKQKYPRSAASIGRTLPIQS